MCTTIGAATTPSTKDPQASAGRAATETRTRCGRLPVGVAQTTVRRRRPGRPRRARRPVAPAHHDARRRVVEAAERDVDTAGQPESDRPDPGLQAPGVRVGSRGAQLRRRELQAAVRRPARLGAALEQEPDPAAGLGREAHARDAAAHHRDRGARSPFTRSSTAKIQRSGCVSTSRPTNAASASRSSGRAGGTHEADAQAPPARTSRRRTRRSGAGGAGAWTSRSARSRAGATAPRAGRPRRG